jgi:hypothetical protein
MRFSSSIDRGNGGIHESCGCVVFVLVGVSVVEAGEGEGFKQFVCEV